MSSTIRIKRSSVAGKLPNTTNISTGELALNLADGRLYSSNGTNVFEVGANVASLAVGSGGFSIANGAITFPISDGTNGQALVSDGNGTLSFENISVANAVTFAVSNTLTVDGSTIIGGDLTVSGDLNVTGDITLNTVCNTSIYFATGGETKVAVGYSNTNLVIVSLNGSELTPTYDYTSTDNINIGNLEPLDAGDVLVIREFKGTVNNIRVL
jgi:hypothetical protein